MGKDTTYIYKTLLDNIPHKIFYKDLNSVYLLCNKSYAKDLKIKPSQIKGKTDYDFFPEKLAEKYRSDDNAIMRKGKTREIEEKYIKDGIERITHTLKAPLRDNEDKIVGIFGIFWDITEYREAEKILQRSEERFMQVAETAGGWIWEVDTTGLYTYASPTVKNILGYKPNELVGKKYFYSLFIPEIRGKLKKKAFQFFCMKKPFKGFVNKNMHRDGHIVYLETSGLPILSKTGKLLGYRGTDTDVTARKKADEILRGLKDNLEIEVEKKTGDLILAHRDLESSKRLADIGALAATVAHELRNPLGVIKTAVYNIKHKSKDKSIVSHLNNIDKKIHESDIIIKNLLSYSKVMVPQYQTVLICDLIAECVRNFRAKYSVYDVEVSMNCECNKGDEIEADPVHITSLFSNILDNSYQSFYDKRGAIEIKSHYSKKDNSFQIYFKDNGPGISKVDFNKLFEPFFTTKAKGIGLGLTVCKQIISLHNGSINITSKKSQGTTVSITLPISRK